MLLQAVDQFLLRSSNGFPLSDPTSIFAALLARKCLEQEHIFLWFLINCTMSLSNLFILMFLTVLQTVLFSFNAIRILPKFDWCTVLKFPSFRVWKAFFFFFFYRLKITCFKLGHKVKQMICCQTICFYFMA